jgi:predicted ribosomally synthesized peptide with SipW-like signal peptide
MKKRRIVFNMALSSIVLILFTILYVATTVAYFSDHLKYSNEITAGNVKIELSEAAVKKDPVGHFVKDPDSPRVSKPHYDYGTIYPSQSIFKDPNIKNVGSEDAWVAFKVTINDGRGDLRKLIGYPGSDHVDIHVFFSGALFSEKVQRDTWNNIPRVIYNDNYAMAQIGYPDADKYEFYIFILKPLAKNEDVTIFDNMYVPEDWTNTEMQELADLKIDVEAFGVQTFNFDSCFTAMKTALPEYFPFN